MKQIEIDALRNEKWSGVYGDVPDSVSAGVQFAFARIRALERRKKIIVRVAACAACMAIVLGAGGAVLGGKGDSPDRIAAPVAQAKLLSHDSIVHAARADGCFHVYSGCSAAMAEQVEVQLVTALEFEKKLCPVCGVNVQLPE